jgi:hypothetical protein
LEVPLAKTLRVQLHDLAAVSRFCKSVAWASVTDNYTRVQWASNRGFWGDVANVFKTGGSPDAWLDLYGAPKFLAQPSAKRIQVEIQCNAAQLFDKYKAAARQGPGTLKHFRFQHDRLRAIHLNSIFSKLDGVAEGNERVAGTLGNAAARVKLWASLSLTLVTLPVAAMTPAAWGSATGLVAVGQRAAGVVLTNVAATGARCLIDTAAHYGERGEGDFIAFVRGATAAGSREGSLTAASGIWDVAGEMAAESRFNAPGAAGKAVMKINAGLTQIMSRSFQGFSIYFAAQDVAESVVKYLEGE